MSVEKYNSNLLESNSSTNKIHQLRLYYIRLHDIKDDLKLKIDFNNEINLTFNEGKQLDNKTNFSPFIYILDLILKMDNNEQLYIKYEEQFKSIDGYRLKMSRPISIVKTIIHEEKRDKPHSLRNHVNDQHLFLFDIHFHKYIMFHVPGLDTNIYTELCLYTYFILYDKIYHLFNIIAYEFQSILLKNTYTFDQYDFNDFFEKCNKYLYDILTNSDKDLITLKILIRMIGLLSIKKENIDRYNICANRFTNKIMFHVREEFVKLLELVNTTEWILFKSGLTTLLCIELLSSKLNNSNDNKITFLCHISDEIKREDIANELLYQLYKLDLPILSDSNWTDLFTIVNPLKITINHLNLAASFKTFIICITKISRVLIDYNQFQEQITDYFENRILLNYIRINLKSIIYLINFLQEELLDDHQITKHLLSTVQSTIHNSFALKQEIKDYFDNLEIKIENFEEISFVLRSIHKFQMLSYVDKYEVLYKSVKEDDSKEFYIKWFQYFLAKTELWNDDNGQKQWKMLFEIWTNYSMSNYIDITGILMEIDKLLNAFDNDVFRLYFIEYIIEICFKQESIFRVIEDGLFNVQNEFLRKRFKIAFEQKYLNNSQQNLFNEITNNDKQLHELIKLNKRENNKSIIIHDLIQVICDKIELNKEELIDLTFKNPTKINSIYTILFEESFKTLPIHMKIIEQLISIWEQWENDGFQYSEIQIWNKLNNEQCQIASKIWNFIGQKAKKVIRFENLIDEVNRKFQIVLKIKENVTLCINNYCQDASDKNRYFNHLENIEKQLDKEKVKTIQIPKQIEMLRPFADRLNFISESHTWRRFLQQQKSEDKTPDSIMYTTDICVDQTDILNEESKANVNNDQQEITCLQILKQTEEILDQFIIRLNNFCIDKEQPLLPQMEQFFPEKHLIDHEFQVLKVLLDETIISYLEILLEYWKNYDRINHICNGCINLSEYYKISSIDQQFVLQNILSINHQTSIETCYKSYQEYCTYYSKIYCESILKLIGQWSLSKELLKYLYSLNATDVDNLLEIVNDWDETLINTKTVLDFVLLKRFLHQIDIMIKSINEEKSLEFNDIINCFEKVWIKTEFKNILNNFESCSKCLFSIQRICKGPTNKEQPKRRRILDIMKNSHFCFCIHQLKEINNGGEYQFDVHIINNNWEPISFNDLSELRDRARLIQYASNNNNTNLQNYTDDHIQQLQLFVSFVETIEIILQNLISLNTAGYPVVKEYPMSKRKFTCNEGNYDELDKFKMNLEIQLNDWEKKLYIMYEKCPDLTYFSYQQIWMVENSLYKQTITSENDPGYHFLKFIGIDPQAIQFELLPKRSEEPYNRLENMAEILNTQRIKKNFHLQEDEQKNKKIFLIETSNRGILRAIYSIFHLNKLPIIANQLFYCTKNTNWIEIRSFIYRCFYSQTLHQLIRPDLLSLVIQDKFAQLLNQLIEQNPKHFFLLSIITIVSSAHLHIVNSLKTYRLIQIIHDQDMLNESELENLIQSDINNNSMLVTSRIAGLGKSTYIHNQILQLNKKHVKFSISGDMNMDLLTERLRDKKVQSISSTIAIHINIGPVENIQQLNEFLYCLILFRCFRLGQIPVYIPANIPIFIELDSSSYLINLKDQILVFQYLKTKYIDYMNWDELETNNSLKIQLIVNYLQNIENQTINTKDINEKTIILLDKSTCIRLLKNYFLNKKNIEFISWTQLFIFISIYYKLFSGFSQCGHFLVDPDNISSLRIDLLKILLNSSDQFTTLSVEKIRQNQRLMCDNKIILPFSDAIIRWDKLQPFTLIFTATDDPLFVYKTFDDIPVSLINAFQLYYQLINQKRGPKRIISSFFKFFSKNNTETSKSSKTIAQEQLNEFLMDHSKMSHEQFFTRLTLLSTKYFIKSICKKCFNQYEYTEQQCTICPTKDDLIRPNTLTDDDIKDFQKKVAKILQSEYVLTADNYVKMLLIYLRVQSGLPVLIMGETGKRNRYLLINLYQLIGCGKTALIQFLCQKILDDEMVIFRIHAGVTSEKIIETMHEFIRKAQKCLEKDRNKRLWVFLDEFNTTPNIGLLKEIICERTLPGKILPKNIVLLGACNPQRYKKKMEEFDDDIGIKKHHSESLCQVNAVNPSSLYSVISIPETMLEYVWDYGYLDEITEMSYIRAILNVCEQLTENHIWFNCIVKLIGKSQKFFREREDVSSVSLRDVVRFCRFYNWFYKFALPYEDQQMFILHSFNSIERASLLALLLCYYFRCNSSIERNNYMSTIENSIAKIKPDVSINVLNTLLQNEKMSLIERMELPAGTAKNRALTDNIFVLFTCILNQIPVILCGKPGSSKTSAVQIIISNLQGKKSEDLFFQDLPELIAVSYQGSQNCTSESILKVFARADKYSDAKSEIQLLPVIVFDEIGLAELSPHNPLKVLHSELEIEKCRHGFVGLSNWRLDPSKMNRAVYLSCPDPDLDDLKTTAITLSQSMLSDDTQGVPLDDFTIESLANAYMNTCDHLKQYRNQYYFGLRDYYALIKGIARDMLLKNNKQQNLYEIIRYQLSVNFGGTTDGSMLMWSKFCEYIHQNHLIENYLSPTFDQLINQSLLSRTGRFLMLIGESENSFDYVQRYINIKHPSIQTRTLIGSTFSGDYLSNTTYTEQYNNRVLMDIILYAETNTILFLRGLGHLYDNLYDLFNQNFAVSAKKKFCRIALGSLYHPRCIIHDDFYCIVFVKKQDLDKYDPPFLNRFEKHLIDIDILIHQYHQIIISKLNKWINQLILIKLNTNFPLRKHLFIEYNNDYIFNLVTNAFDYLNISNNFNDDNEEDKNIEYIIKYCQNQMIRTSSFDFPLLLSLNSQINQRNYFIEQYYKIHTNLSFSSYINEILEKKTIPKLLIYTYTQIYHIIDYNDHNKSIEEIKLSYFKTEFELIQKIKMHYQKGNSRLLCIRVDYHQEYEHIPMLKHILLNEQFLDQTRGICLIFHLQRHMLNQINNDILFNEWSTIMIDNLQEHKIIPMNILFKPSYRDLIIHLKFLSLEQIFDELIDQCIIKFCYKITNKQQKIMINERRNRIIQEFSSQIVKNNDHLSLRLLIKNQLSEMFENIPYSSNQIQFNDWRQDLLTNEIIISSCNSFDNALIKIVSFFIDNCLSLLFTHIEKHLLIDSYFFLIDSNEQIRNKLISIWLDCWTIISKTIDVSIINQTNIIEIPLVFDLHLPCSIAEYEIIRQIRETITQDGENNNNNENELDFALKQLTSKSIYGSSIDKILQDSDIFTHYYHDQLTLIRNEINIHRLSTSYIQHLTSKISNNVKDQLAYLLINYEELINIIQLFEIGLEFIGKEEKLFKILDKQIMHNDNKEKTIRNHTDLYCLIIRETDFYVIPPQSSDRKIFKCKGDPFIEISLMNLIEFLLSPSVFEKINDIERLIISYNLFAQHMIKLTRYGHYEIINLEKFHSFLYLVTCISNLFPINQALDIFQQVYGNYAFYLSSNTLDQIHYFISYLNKIIHQKQSTINDEIIHRTLLKFENQILRNWFIENNTKSNEILKFINNHNDDLWKYSTKIMSLIDKTLELSLIIRENNGQILEYNEYEEINQYLSQLNNSTEKIEILLMIHIYIQLIFNENYFLRINQYDKQQLIEILTIKFDYFKKNLNEIEYIKLNEKLKIISLISWIRYYIQYYIYALKNDLKDRIMNKIDKLLTDNNSKFYSTIKLFIIKQLCQINNITFHCLSNQFSNRNLIWIRFISSDRQILEPQYNIILPTPLFEYSKEFILINNTLSSCITYDQLRNLIKQCSIRQDLSYCFIIWFIHYYLRFYLNNILPDNQFVKLIKDDLKKELINCFESIGYKLIVCLCNNFDENSYFHLKPFIPEEDLHQRLIVLNIIALFISFKSFRNSSFLSSFLYDENLKIPKNYHEHFQKFDYLTGIDIINDSAFIQMINIQTEINEQKKRNNQDELKMNIFRCSSDCFWIFYFINYDIPNEQKKCPLCQKEININQNENILIINNPHIQMNINETLQFITKYIKQYKEMDDFQLYNCQFIKEKDFIKKHNYLTQPITYHFIHLLIHAIFLFLNELNFMTYSTKSNCIYFRKQIEKDYTLLCQHLSNVDQCYIWIYKLINHMTNDNFVIKGNLNSYEKVMELEKLIEDKLILPHINSVINEIREYKSKYADFVYGNNKQNIFVNFVDELIEDNENYPLLNFFNVINIDSINIIDHFYTKLQLLPDFEKNYPLTTFLLKHLSDYTNIQYLYPIIKIINYFIENFNYRIKRNDTMKKTIGEYLENDSDLKIIYQDFVNAWSKINLNEKKIKFKNFQLNDNETNISMFLLNKSNDNENKILIDYLQIIGNFQNDIIDYYYSYINKYPNKIEKSQHRIVSFQTIKSKDLFHFDKNKIKKLLFENGLIINYMYGMNKDIIYNYDEIESILINEINYLPLIDIKNIRFFNYQFEFYDENISLINNIRQRFQQKLFDDYQRIEIQKVIERLDNNSILQLFDLLQYILTYLCNINNKNLIKTSTIQTFINEFIYSKKFINNKFQQKPFSSIYLEYIIDLYELIEESIFDKIFHDHIRDELSEKSFNNDDRISIINQFIDMILYNNNIENSFKDFIIWINMFKRLLVRLLYSNININFNSSLQNYIKRNDLWKGNISLNNIQTIEINKDIRLKHAFIILKGLQTKQNEIKFIEEHRSITNNTSIIDKPRSQSMSSSQKRKEPKTRKDLRQ